MDNRAKAGERDNRILQISSKQFAEHVPGGRFEWHTLDGAVYVVRPHRAAAIAHAIAKAADPQQAVALVQAYVAGFADAKGDRQRSDELRTNVIRGVN